ncbi:MAG: GTP-binding protein [Candidatus Lokiarchaeota archaeon]
MRKISQDYHIVKVIIDGRGGVGKTTMLKSLTSGNFDPKTEITIGVDFFSKQYNLFDYNVLGLFWDLGGVNRFDFLRESFYDGAHSIILVGDLTRSTTFEDLKYFIDTAKNVNINSDQIILVGNKTDLFDFRSIIPSYLELFSEQFEVAELIETSARFNDNLELVFELAIAIGLHKQGILKDNIFEDYKETFENRIQKPVLDPSQKIVRKCWECKRTLFFSEFSSTNSSISKERLINLWESNYIEFLCCSCYKNKEKNNI